MNFDISTGLKSVLGSELITNDEVALFELVKNSFDADASEVHILFGHRCIMIVDNGTGMTKEEIQSKWLFVGYSSKKLLLTEDNFREAAADRKKFAGSKGIGRFSSDRLGSIVQLYTRPRSEQDGPVHIVTVNWDQFDENHLDHFENIDVTYRQSITGFQLPTSLPRVQAGTVIKIKSLKTDWNRAKLLRLRSGLAKLINPFGAKTDGFKIFIHSPSEIESDRKAKLPSEVSEDSSEQANTVNGEIKNFIFSTLQEKTTFLDVRVEETTNTIMSSLVDRGELIYKIREPNPYPRLSRSGFSCQLYFLNLSAKLTFARRMGLESVKFGSVFLFRNGFRVFPIGEEGDDWFRMDRRKQQGYARFLGTRDVIGRIDVMGDDSDFQESSSRNTGLIETPAVEQLKQCFHEYCLKRLEKYVVPVTFVDPEDKNTSDVSRLLTDPGRSRVIDAVAKLVDNQEIELLDFSKRLVGILNERSSQFESSLAGLKSIAEKTKDSVLFNNIVEAEERFLELRKSEREALRIADEERLAKEDAIRRAETERKAREIAEKRATIAETAVASAESKLHEEKSRNLFLTSVSSLDMDTILNLHHQVTIYSVDLQQQIENFIFRITQSGQVSVQDVLNSLDRISLLNKKVMGVTKFATKANFRLESEMILADIGDYVEQYINGVARDYLLGPITIRVTNDKKPHPRKFKPIDISVVLDNLISNAKKAKASSISVEITHPSKDVTHILFYDNGRGFDKKIDNVDRIFEKGFTMTDGSGLGLYHVRHVLGELGGTIEVDHNKNAVGASFLIRISK